MALDLDLVGRRGATTTYEWTARDAAIYALGIGAGQDPLDLGELRYVAEDTVAGPQLAYPMMAMAIGVDGGDRPPFGDIDRSRFVHAEQSLVMHAPLPVDGRVELDCEAVGLADKGSGALVTWETRARKLNGAPLFTMRSSAFLREGGGFGGDRGPSSEWVRPAREPDSLVRLQTHPTQALLYRLSGDRNPLHADPATATRGGYERPILHGLSLLGAAARVILGADAHRLHELQARFSAPVLPGDALSVRIWRDGDATLFQAITAAGVIALDHGRLTSRSQAEVALTA